MSSGFDATRANTYDNRIGRMIPGYDVLHRLVDVCLGAELPPEAKVLMVGAGTGAEVLACGLRHPGWTVTAVEPSQDMSALGLEKVKAQGLAPRVHWHCGALETLEADEPFDAATLLLVLHFVPNNGEKLELLTGIAELLKPGAPLLLASFVGDPTTTRTKKMYELGKAWAIAGGMDPKEVEEKINLARKDVHLVPEEKIKTLLRDAGFIDVQRLFQGLSVIAWTARTNR